MAFGWTCIGEKGVPGVLTPGTNPSGASDSVFVRDIDGGTSSTELGFPDDEVEFDMLLESVDPYEREVDEAPLTVRCFPRMEGESGIGMGREPSGSEDPSPWLPFPFRSATAALTSA